MGQWSSKMSSAAMSYILMLHDLLHTCEAAYQPQAALMRKIWYKGRWFILCKRLFSICDWCLFCVVELERQDEARLWNFLPHFWQNDFSVWVEHYKINRPVSKAPVMVSCRQSCRNILWLFPYSVYFQVCGENISQANIMSLYVVNKKH